MHTHRGFAVQNAHTSAGSTIRKVTSKKKERKVTRVKFFPPSSHGFNSCRLKLLKDDWGSLINFSRLKIFQLKSTYRVFFLKQEIKSKQKHKFLKWMLAKPFPGIRFFHGNSFPMMSHAYFRTKFSLISHPIRYFPSNKRLPSIPRRLATQKTLFITAQQRRHNLRAAPDCGPQAKCVLIFVDHLSFALRDAPSSAQSPRRSH